MHPELAHFYEICEALERGQIRVAEPIDGQWTVHSEIKTAILAGFKHGVLQDMSQGGFSFWDKDTFPVRKFTENDQVRIVPGGTSIRRGAYLAPGVIVMPPAYINVGAYVDSGTLIDSHALVGSCAQIGKRVHLSAGAQIGGVLEPVGARPVILEDEVFVGGNAGIFEGVLVQKGAVIATGVILNGSTAVYDATTGELLRADDQGCLKIPPYAVVVAGSRPIRHGKGSEDGIQLYTPVIIKYRDGKTDQALTMEDWLR